MPVSLSSHRLIIITKVLTLTLIVCSHFRVITIFGFSLCAVSLLVVLVIYFRRDTQDIISRQVYEEIEGILLLILKVSDSFS